MIIRRAGAAADGFTKLDSNGSIVWQHDLTGAYAAGTVIIEPLADGSYVSVGNESPTNPEILQGLIMKISSTGALQWSVTYSETDQSFQGAYTGGNFTFESVQQTPDGGYITSGVADAKFSSGYAQVLVAMKLDASGNAQWTNAYYGPNWVSGPAGDAKYPIFQTSDGSYVLSGTVQQPIYPFQELLLLVKLDFSWRGPLAKGIWRVKQ